MGCYNLEYISVRVTPPNRLTFWDGAPILISGIRAMSDFGPDVWKILGMDRVWAVALWDKSEGQWSGWLASSSAVTTGRPERGCDSLFDRGDI